MERFGYSTDHSLCFWHFEEKGLKTYVLPCAGIEYPSWKAQFEALFFTVDDSMTEEVWEEHWAKLVEQARAWQTARLPQLKKKIFQNVATDGHTIQGGQRRH